MVPLIEEETLIVPLSEVSEALHSSVGAKAARLGALRRAGFRVPEGFCITVEAYRRSIELCGLERWWDKPPGEREMLRRRLREQDLPADLADRVRAAHRELLRSVGSDVTLAVRSSAVLEDARGSSFAGIYDSVLRVDGPDALIDAIRQCWLSSLSDRVLDYLKRFGHAPEANGMAVLVQRMIEGQVSGVMFTANPATGNPAEVCVDAVRGACEAVVSGDDASVRLVIDRDGPSATTTGAPLLPAGRVDKLLELAAGVERRFDNVPQDIEWGFRDEELWVLQARPVTALPPYFPFEEAQNRVWNLDFMGIFSPFGASMELVKNRIYYQALQRLTGKRVRNDQRVINGYIYYSTDPVWWSRFSPNRRIKALRPFFLAERDHREFHDEIVPGYLHVIEAAEDSLAGTSSLEELTAQLESLVQAYFDFQRRSLAVAGIANLFPRLLKRFCLLSGVADGGLEALSLITGEESETTRRDRQFDTLCRELGRGELGPLVLHASSLDEARQALAAASGGRSFLDRWDAFYLQYGYTWACGNPKDPGWEEDPSVVLAALKRGLTAGGKSLPERLAAGRLERDRTERELLQRLWRPARPLFRQVLTRCRRYFPTRENRNHVFYRGVAAIRSTLHCIGRVLHERDFIASPEDVFYLTYEETSELLNASRVAEVAARVEERQTRYASYRRLKPPNILGGQPVAGGAGRPTRAGSVRLSGLPCSPGMVRGRARIVHTPRELSRLEHGEILVISKVRPYFATALGVAGGLVTEEGSLLSHGANIAREYGVPAVLGVRGVTTTLKDGDTVAVDGAQGTVEIEEPAR